LCWDAAYRPSGPCIREALKIAFNPIKVFMGSHLDQVVRTSFRGIISVYVAVAMYRGMRSATQ
jgi:hypothetical protein